MDKNIDSAKVLYSKGGNDECYTPRYGVEPIIEYIKKDWTVWCPFDTKDSEFVKVLKENGINVIYSHMITDMIFSHMNHQNIMTVLYQIHLLQIKENTSKEL